MRHNSAHRRDRRWAVLRRLAAIAAAAFLLLTVTTTAGAASPGAAVSPEAAPSNSMTAAEDPTPTAPPATAVGATEPQPEPGTSSDATPSETPVTTDQAPTPTPELDPVTTTAAPVPSPHAPVEMSAPPAPQQLEEAEPAPERADVGLFSVPTPPANSAVVSVKVGGDRTAGDTISATGLAGVRLRLSSSATNVNAWSSQGWTWTDCVSDADGDCNFVIPILSSSSASATAAGMGGSQRPYVHQVSAPAGWRLNASLRTGAGNGSSSDVRPYLFRIDRTLTRGSTSRSTSVSDFMITSTSNDNEATSAGHWQVARDNPAQVQQCGLKYAVLMDLSGSIGSQLPTAKTALNTFIGALRGTPSSVALFSFDLTSPASNGTNRPALRPVRTAAEGQVLINEVNGWSLGSGTNWDAGLYAVAAAAPDYDVLVVITDGNPTSFGTGTAPNQYGNNRLRDIEAGIFSANLVKAGDTRIVTVGVGNGAGGDSDLNLRAISGPTLNSDYFQVGDYAAAATTLAQLAKGNCEGSIDVIKKVIPASKEMPTNPTKQQLDSIAAPAAGWQINPVGTGAGVSFGLPAGPWTTDTAGHATIPLRFPTPTAVGPVSWTETQRAGHVLQPVAGRNAVCINTDTNAPAAVTDIGTTAAPGVSLPVAVNTAIECTVYNRELPLPATVTVTKQVTDTGGSNPQPARDWTLGAATTGTTGTVTQVPTATTQVTPDSGTVSWGLTFSSSTARATVAVSETQQSGFLFVRGECRVTSAAGSVRTVTLTGVSGSVTGVTAGDTVACTIVNRPTAPMLVVSKTSDPVPGTVVDPGTEITYTLRFANTAGTAPAQVAHTDVLTRALDDATLESGPTIHPTGGLTAQLVDGSLVITGQVPAGATVTVSYKVRIKDPAAGDGVLANFLVRTGQQPPATCESTSTTCTTHAVAPTLTLVKQVGLGSATPRSWTLTATGPTGSRPGPSGQHSSGTPVTAAVTADRSYVLTESGGPATYVQSGAWVCVDTNPTAGTRVSSTGGAVTLAAGAAARCTVTNSTATITLLKEVEGGSAAPSAWNLTATPASLAGLTPTTVAGATSSSAFEVRPGHPYTLTETPADPYAPLAYRQDRLERLNPDGTWSTVTGTRITAPAAGASATYRYVNKLIDPVQLPLTGGLSTDLFLLAGGAAALVATAGAGWAWRRRSMA